MPRRSSHGPVRAALETTLSSNPKLAEPRHAALVALCRVTAEQVDQAGADVSSRLIASYLSALKDLDKALDNERTPTSPRKSGGGAGGGDSNGSALGALRGIKGGKAV